MGKDVLGTGIKADQPSPYTSYADEPLAPLTSASLAFSVHAMFTTILSESQPLLAWLSTVRTKGSKTLGNIRCTPSRRRHGAQGLLPFMVDCQIKLSNSTPSLHPHYRTSSLLRVDPPLCSASVLSLSRDFRLSFSLYIGTTGSRVPS